MAPFGEAFMAVTAATWCQLLRWEEASLELPGTHCSLTLSTVRYFVQCTGISNTCLVTIFLRCCFLVRTGSKIDELQFISTQNGGVHGPYGGGGGDAYASSFPGCELEYLSGSSGSEVDQLTFHYVCPDGTKFF